MTQPCFKAAPKVPIADGVKLILIAACAAAAALVAPGPASADSVIVQSGPDRTTIVENGRLIYQARAAGAERALSAGPEDEIAADADALAEVEDAGAAEAAMSRIDAMFDRIERRLGR